VVFLAQLKNRITLETGHAQILDDAQSQILPRISRRLYFLPWFGKNIAD
jgi:hypothetical protein